MKKYFRRMRPIKGAYYWEMQVAMVVIMWKHDNDHPSYDNGLSIGRLYIWRDSMWRL